MIGKLMSKGKMEQNVIETSKGNRLRRRFRKEESEETVIVHSRKANEASDGG
jgi:hypothetical protein